MDSPLTAVQIKLRDRRYRRTPALRCKDANDIRTFVDDVGLCLLFPIKGIEMPTVYEAVAGFAKPMNSKHDDPTGSITWNTKDTALDKRWWYYGKLLRSKATFVSLKLLPAFYALSENFGEDDDYLQLFRDGALSTEARAIYEALMTHGALHAIQLKRESGFYGEEKKARFDRALVELQAKLMVVPTGVAEAGAWRYAYIYDALHRWEPDAVRAARDLSRSDARRMIARQHLRNVVVCTPKDMARLFGWSLTDAERALA